MTSKVDMGQNKTIKVTQRSFLIRLPNVTSNCFSSKKQHFNKA